MGTPASSLPWQPITFGGVASFARASFGRLFIVQFIVALLVAGSVSCFLAAAWFPVAQKAIARSGLENGKVDLISMENAYAETVNPGLKAEKKRKADELKNQIQEKTSECFKSVNDKCMEELHALQKQQMNSMMGAGQRQWDLAWRIFIEGPRGRKDYYADKQGNIVDTPY